MLLGGRDVNCVIEEHEVSGFRDNVKSISASCFEAHFYSRRRSEILDFGVVPVQDDKFSFRHDATGGFRVHLLKRCGVQPRFTVVLIPGISGRWTTSALLQVTLLRSCAQVLYFDGRGVGENCGLERTFGYLEAGEIANCIAQLVEMEVVAPQIGLFGMCLGAATGLRTATLTAHVQAVVVEGLYSNVLQKLSQLKPEMQSEAERVKRRYGISEADVSPLNIARRFPRIPLRMIWGQHDRVVSMHERSELVQAFGERASTLENEIVRGCSHVLQYGFPMQMDQALTYFEGIASFFKKNLESRHAL